VQRATCDRLHGSHMAFAVISLPLSIVDLVKQMGIPTSEYWGLEMIMASFLVFLIVAPILIYYSWEVMVLAAEGKLRDLRLLVPPALLAMTILVLIMEVYVDPEAPHLSWSVRGLQLVYVVAAAVMNVLWFFVERRLFAETTEV
jgi:hypothetical protein